MRSHGALVVVVALVGWALVPYLARAHTGEDKELTCTRCEKTFESYVQGSGRLDSCPWIARE